MGSDNLIVKFNIPQIQKPSLTSFDPKADLMTIQPVKFNYDGSGVVHDGLKFQRILAYVKILFKDDLTAQLHNEPLRKLSWSTNQPNTWLTGYVNVDLENEVLAENPFYSTYKYNNVKAEFPASMNFQVDGVNSTILCVPAYLLSSGTTLTFTAETQHYTINKVVTLASDIQLVAGSIYTLKLGTAGVTEKQVGAPLPFHHGFDGLGSGNIATTSTGAPSSTVWADGTYSSKTGGMFVDGAACYDAGDAVKFSNTSNPIGYGKLVTKALDLSEEFTVRIVWKPWLVASKYGYLKVTAGTQTYTYTLPSAVAPGAWSTQYYTFDAESELEQVTFEAVTGTSYDQRMFIDDIRIYNGHFIDVSPLTQAVTATGGNFSATVDSDVVTWTVGTEQSWIHITSANGVSPITYTVDANTDIDVRNGSIVVSGVGDPVAIAVNQAGKPTAVAYQAGWKFSGSTSAQIVACTSNTPSGVATIGSLTGTNFLMTPSTDCWGSTAFNGNESTTTYSKYASFTVTVKNYVSSISNVKMRVRTSPTGPTKVALMYQINNAGSWTVIDIWEFAPTKPASTYSYPTDGPYTYDLSNIGLLQNMAKNTLVTFCIVPIMNTWTLAAGTWFISNNGWSAGNSLEVNGTYVP